MKPIKLPKTGQKPTFFSSLQKNFGIVLVLIVVSSILLCLLIDSAFYSAKWIPATPGAATDLGSFFTGEFLSITRAILLSVASASIAGFSGFILYRRIMRDYIQEEQDKAADNIINRNIEKLKETAQIRWIKSLIQKAVDSCLQRFDATQRPSLVQDLATVVNNSHYRGLTNVHRSLKLDIISDYIKNSEYVQIVETWIAEKTLEHLSEALGDAISQGKKISIALLNPNSPLTLRRRIDLLKDKKSWEDIASTKMNTRDNIIIALRTLKEINDKHKPKNGDPSSLRVICYDSLPTLQIYRFAKRAVSGFYFKGAWCTHASQLAIDLESGLGKEIQDHLDLVFKPNCKESIIEVNLDKSIDEQFNIISPIDGVDLTLLLHRINKVPIENLTTALNGSMDLAAHAGAVKLLKAYDGSLK